MPPLFFKAPKLGGTLGAPSLMPQASCHLSAKFTAGKGAIKCLPGLEGALIESKKGCFSDSLQGTNLNVQSVTGPGEGHSADLPVL